jgi:FKBP-type peptidyl-prolyl cis-trans isomerase
MAMRSSALYALLLVAAVGCGVPEPPTQVASSSTAGDSEKPSKPVEPKNTTTKPATPDKATSDKTTPSEPDPASLGLKIIDTKVGTGAVAEPGDTCFMLYTGKLKSNGTVFDSTEKHGGDPFSFPLGQGQVIKGWDLGVKGMRVGGKRTLEIPAELGYGAQGSGDTIPPNSDLVFDIELVDVLKVKDSDVVVRKILKPGTGPAAKVGDVVSIKYKGESISGKVFDDNGGKPVQFKLGSGALAVPGLDLAVQGMKVGETLEARIPPALGYGPAAMRPGSKVPQNSILKFEITLVSVG